MNEKTYSVYNPSLDAFQEVSYEQAVRFVEAAKEVEKQLTVDQKLADKAEKAKASK